MTSFTFPCPFCGREHPLILGATLVQDRSGAMVTRCVEEFVKEEEKVNA